MSEMSLIAVFEKLVTVPLVLFGKNWLLLERTGNFWEGIVIFGKN